MIFLLDFFASGVLGIEHTFESGADKCRYLHRKRTKCFSDGSI